MEFLTRTNQFIDNNHLFLMTNAVAFWYKNIFKCCISESNKKKNIPFQTFYTQEDPKSSVIQWYISAVDHKSQISADRT